MKKNIFKKIVASLATAAMAVGMFAAMPATDAKAADELYVIGDFCGWSWDKSATLTSTDGKVYKGEIEVSGDTDIVINTAKNWDGGDAAKMPYMYGGAETIQTKVAFANAGKYELTYNKTTKEMTTAAKSTVKVNWTYSYVVAGNPEIGAADWGADVKTATAGVMTEKDGKYTVTVTATKAGDYEYKIVKVGTPDVASVDKTADWLGNPDDNNQNFKVKVEKGVKYTVTFDAKTGKSTVAKAVAGGSTTSTTGGSTTPTTGGSTTPTTGAGSTTPTTGTGTVNPENTGDSSAMIIMLAVAAVAAGAVIVSRKRTVNE